LSTNAKTKEEYLSKSCQGRIRGYLAKAESQMKLTDWSQDELRSIAESVLDDFRAKLKEQKYYGHFFDRKSDSEPMCDADGKFRCEGRFDASVCAYDGADDKGMHVINPYESAETRLNRKCFNSLHFFLRIILDTLCTSKNLCPRASTEYVQLITICRSILLSGKNTFKSF
jgi:hypothetical protein